MKLVDMLLIAFGTILVALALTIAVLDVLWYSIKPTVEKTELIIIKDLNDANITMERH